MNCSLHFLLAANGRRLTALAVVVAVLMALGACTGRKVYDHYEQTPLAGWEKNDTLSFGIPPLGADGLYAIDLGLRTTGRYPFMSLTLIVDRLVEPAGLQVPHLTQNRQTDVLNCRLVNEHGNAEGQGINYYQYNFHVADVHLHQGDSLLVRVRHDMKREILPGISDVGIRLTRH